ncbi:hypothetical protein BC829DRAFT_398578 [Chytridium lagenaria]|nr:hypothetical protein BC829DRAFT_398578 [Chytridium lagenaria]
MKKMTMMMNDDDEPNDPRPVVASTSGSFVNSKASASTSSEKVFAEESDDEVPLARIKGNGIGSNINFGSSELAYNTAATNLSDAQAQNWKVVKLEDADAADLPEAQNGTLKAVKVEDEDANITTPDSQSHLVPSETLEDGGSFIPANVNDEDLLFSASPSLDGSEDEIVPLEDYGDFDDMDLVTDDSDDDEPVPNLPICVGPNYKKYGVATFVSWADKEAKEIFPEYYQLAKYDVEDFWRE